MTMITPSYLGETIEYSSLHACRSTLEDPTGPKGVAYSPDQSVLIADTENHVIRRIDLKTGTIVTILGTGQRGDGRDGDPMQCALARPHGLFLSRAALYVSDSENHRIRVLE